MCGIAGIVGIEDKKLIKKMTNIMSHRGPDDEGLFLDKNISLGQRRLSILDLSKNGHQPMISEDESHIIVFNGEVYNYKEIRKKLENKYNFKSESDTEVILYAYKEYGAKCLEMFNGMFAFGIWDCDKQKLFLARDRVGIKPVYYSFVDNKFIFASEMKAILETDLCNKKINQTALNTYLTNSYIPAPLSIFEQINKLEAGYCITFNLKKKQIIKNQYWDCAQIKTNENLTEKETLEKFNKLLESSVNYRLISDVPVGAFLSGGIDSTITVSKFSQIINEKNMNTKIKTFSIGFSESEYDESRYAKDISQTIGTDHHEYYLKSKDINVIPKLVWQFDEPFADPSMLPMHFVSMLARRHVTVSISGDGGDELFGGYENYQQTKYEKYAKRLSSLPKMPRNAISILSSKINYNSANKYIKAIKNINHISQLSNDESFIFKRIKINDEEKKQLFLDKEKYKKFNQYDLFNHQLKNTTSKDMLKRHSYLDMKTFMNEDVLMKVDKTTMFNSLEARVPILDHKIVEFSRTVPSHLKIKNNTTKYILRKYINDRIQKSHFQRPKKGFGIPISEWFRKELKSEISDSLSDNSFLKKYSFNKKYIQKIIKANQGTNFGKKLWTLYSLKKWGDVYNIH